MPIQAQINPSSMSSTGLSDASVDTSEGDGMKSGMPLMCFMSPLIEGLMHSNVSPN